MEEKRQFFLMEFQLINVEETRENYHYNTTVSIAAGTIHQTAKISEQEFE